jgi:hypothetical protein
MVGQAFYYHLNQSKTLPVSISLTLTNSSHMFYAIDDDMEMIAANVDEYGDSYCRDVSIEALRKVD